MKRSPSNLFALAAVAALALQGCVDQRPPTESASRGAFAASVTSLDQAGRHVVVFAAEGVPADLGERAARLGGSVEASLDNIGVAAVTGLTQDAAAALAAQADIRHVEPDEVTTMADDGVAATDGSTEPGANDLLALADP